MKRIAFMWLSILLLGACALAEISPTTLQTEHLREPLGLDVPKPRLSWILQSDQRAQKQSAYQVQASSDAGLVAQDRPDLWDSGKVASNATFDIEYAGKPLASHAQVYWRVRVWDGEGKPSAWSEAAHFSTGPGQFKGQWIGYDKHRRPATTDADFADAKWIGFSGDDAMNTPKAFRVFMKDFELPANAKISKAEVLVTGDDKSWFIINGQQVAQTDGFDRPQLVDVTPHVKAGANHLRAQIENSMPSPAGLIARITITLAGVEKPVTIVTDGTWHATDNGGANWHNREIAADAWPLARVIGDYGMAPWNKLKLNALTLPPPTYLRTTFQPAKPVKHATLYATALGIYQVQLNGRLISTEYFSPGWTDYTKRVYYRTYDVTPALQAGANTLSATLGDGWYSGYVGYGHMRDHYGKKPRFAAQLHIDYADGTSEDVVTNDTWKAATGPILESDFLMGETFDARVNPDNAAWDAVDTGAELKPAIQWHPGPPVRVFAELKAKQITEPSPGVYILNLGQNFAGIPRLTLANPKAGQKVTLRFAERLNPDGTLYTTNLRSARATDTYIARGDAGGEVWIPSFTFHGFQYIEVTGLSSPPTPDTVVGLALSSDTPVAGSFSCSDPLLNQLHSNIVWTQRSNFIDIPTDCPQRDERLGWTGDAQVYVRTATLNTDVDAFFTKWLVDLADGQRADGQFPMVAPVKVAGNDGGPAWADAGVICPWTIYEVYGDRRLLERQYPSMVKFVEFCRKRSTPQLLPPAQFHCFGDWLSINANTPADVIYTAYFARSTQLTARAAAVLGKAEDARKYEELFNAIKAAFNKAYVGPDGRIKGNTQACYVLAIAFDLLDVEKQKLAAQYLVEDIEAKGNHLSTGFIGTKDLMLALSKIGRSDVAYRLLHQDSFPSWLFSIRHGATSIWERWDGWTPDKGFQDPGMNSFAHYSFGAVYGWMVENIGGIHSAKPAYEHIEIAPQLDPKLTSASVTYNSIRGPIATAWKRDGRQLTLDVTLPPNTDARLVLPPATDVRESGRAPLQSPGVGEFSGLDGFHLGSGTYHFTCTLSE